MSCLDRDEQEAQVLYEQYIADVNRWGNCDIMSRPTVEFSRRCAPPATFKKPMISCAQRSAGTTCSALRHPSFAYHPHAPTTPAHDHACTTGLSLNHYRHM